MGAGRLEVSVTLLSRWQKHPGVTDKGEPVKRPFVNWHRNDVAEKPCSLKSETVKNFAVWNHISENRTSRSCLVGWRQIRHREAACISSAAAELQRSCLFFFLNTTVYFNFVVSKETEPWVWFFCLSQMLPSLHTAVFIFGPSTLLLSNFTSIPPYPSPMPTLFFPWGTHSAVSLGCWSPPCRLSFVKSQLFQVIFIRLAL